VRPHLAHFDAVPNHPVDNPPGVSAYDEFSKAGESASQGEAGVCASCSRRRISFRTFGTADGPIWRRSSMAANVKTTFTDGGGDVGGAAAVVHLDDGGRLRAGARRASSIIHRMAC
jgi:hypothetical protein